MLVIKKIVILISITCLLFISSGSQAIIANSNIESGIKSTTATNQISGNVTIIIYNSEGYYTTHQINEIKNYVNNSLKSNFSSLNFNITTIDDTSLFASDLKTIISNNDPQYLLIMGAVSNAYSGGYLTDLSHWTQGTNYTSVKEIGLIDSMRSNSENTIKILINESYTNEILNKSITFANTNLLQIGFMAGVKAALLTQSDKIGLIIDHSLISNFYDHLASPSIPGTNNPYYSFNRADFVNGFIEGVYYSAEHLRNGANIEIKTESHDFINTNVDPNVVMTNYVKDLSDFGADVIFNMEPSLNDIFIQQSNTHNIKTGILGDNNTQASFSMVENSGQIIDSILTNWNSTNVKYSLSYDLSNSNVFSLYPKPNNQLITIQEQLINGTIVVPATIPIQGVPGFSFYLAFIPLVIITIRKKLKK